MKDPTPGSKWPLVLLGKLIAVRNGADYKNNEVAEGGFPVIGSGGEFARSSRYLFDGESVLFGRKGTVDKPLHVVGRFWTVDTMFYTVIGDRILGRFLYYFATTVDYGFFSTNTALPSMTQRDIATFRVPLPPIAQQQQIAEYLDVHTAKIDLLVERQDRLIQTLAERRVSLMNAAVESLGDVDAIPIKYLFAQSRRANSPNSDILSVYREFGVVRKSSQPGNNNKTPEDVSRYLLVEPGDLVVNKMKAWQGSLGISPHTGIVSGDYEVARPVGDSLNSGFAHILLRSHWYISQYRLRSVGVRPSQWRLYWDQLGSIKVPVPNLAVQLQIVEQIQNQIAQMDAISAKAREMIAVLKERRRALISAAVTGKIDVRGLS